MNSAILILALFLLQQPPANPAITAFGVTLQWDANAETDLVGYKVFWGTASRTYGAPVTLGKVTTYKVEGLTTPGVYYFAVTAFNAAGESGYSNEVVLQPGPPGQQAPLVRRVLRVLQGRQVQWGRRAFREPRDRRDYRDP